MLESLKAGGNGQRGTLAEVQSGLAAVTQAAISSKCMHGKVQLLAPGKGKTVKPAAALFKSAQRTSVSNLDGTNLSYHSLH